LTKQAVILCAGKGERLISTERGEDFKGTTPKVLLEVGGQPFIKYVVETLRAAGVEEFFLVVNDHDVGTFATCGLGDVRFVSAKETINEGVLSVAQGLEEEFVLLNGDCYPIMSFSEWREFVSRDWGMVTMKAIGGRDAGMAMVVKDDLAAGRVDCGNIKGMLKWYERFWVSGGLHVGTPQGLHRARMYVDIVMFGQ